MLKRLKTYFHQSLIATALTVLLPSIAFAQAAPAAAPELSIRALYETKSFLPGSFIPLQVSGTKMTSGAKIIDIQAESSDGADCRVIADPYIALNFLAKCRTATTMTIRLKVLLNDKISAVAYGPMEIKLPSPDLVAVDIDPLAAKIRYGLSVYSTSCWSCHTDAGARFGGLNIKVADIQRGIDVQPLMNTPALRDLRSDTKALEAIEAYLGSLK